jgi:hypothetical protein
MTDIPPRVDSRTDLSHLYSPAPFARRGWLKAVPTADLEEELAWRRRLTAEVCK